jgi:undecaprenyl-diphosphatase
MTAAIVRCRRDGWLLALGAAVLVLGALPVEEGSMSAVEKAVFAALNDIPDVVPFVVVWPFMQLGNFIVLPIAVVVALILRRWRLAGALALAGLAAYLGAKLVKRVIERGRPAAELDDVTIRGDASHGLGFVSGHAALVTALVTVAWPYLNRVGRGLALAATIVVCLSRVYVGAHLPLDVVAGAGLGLAAGSLVNLLLGRPGPCR